MTDSEKIAVLRRTLSSQLAEYRKYSALEASGEVDESYIYDCAEEWFISDSRSIFSDILSILDDGSHP